MSLNTLELSGEVSKIADLRYTPAGIPVLSFDLHHVSEQVEATMKRKVECVVPSLAMGPLALALQQVEEGSHIVVTGFLAKRSLKSAQLVLHVQTLKKII